MSSRHTQCIKGQTTKDNTPNHEPPSTTTLDEEVNDTPEKQNDMESEEAEVGFYVRNISMRKV